MKKKLIAISIILCMVVFIFLVLRHNKEKNNANINAIAEGRTEAVPVHAIYVKKEPIKLDFSVNGKFIPYKDLTLLSESSGTISHIAAGQGSHIKRGQVLAYLDDESLKNLAENAKANYKIALTNFERYQHSSHTGGVTQQQLDQAHLAVENAQANLKEATRKLKDASIKSPINGIVNKRFIEQGSYVSPGTQLFELVDIAKLKFSVTVDESQVGSIHVGDWASIELPTYPGQAFKGKVVFIAPKADNTLSFPTEIELTNSTRVGVIKAGMYGTAIFKPTNQGAAIMIPRSSFISGVGSNKVFLLVQGKAQEHFVTAGRAFGDRIEIVEGLEEGDSVITSGQINLEQGSRVRLVTEIP